MADIAPKITFEDNTPPKPKATPKAATAAKPAAPKTASSGTVSSDVKRAMAVLDSSYNMLALGLTLFGLTDTAEEWIDSADALRESNAESLTAAPKLAKAIASAGGTGGSAAFIITHAMALVSLGKVGARELAAKREAKPKPEPVVNPDVNPLIPNAPASPDPTFINFRGV